PLEEAPTWLFCASTFGMPWVLQIQMSRAMIAFTCASVHASPLDSVSIEIVASLPWRSASARRAVSTYCSTKPDLATQKWLEARAEWLKKLYSEPYPAATWWLMRLYAAMAMPLPGR